MVDTLKVASPCSANWDEMVGNDQVRFCLSCEKNVYNLSAMPREQAEALLQARAPSGEVCVRFYQRADGTVMTQDCPVGQTRKRRKMIAIAVASAGAMVATAAAALAGRGKCDVLSNHEPVMMGAAVAMPDPTTTATTTVTPPVAPPTMQPPLNAEPPRHTMGAVAPLRHTMGKPSVSTKEGL